MTARSADRRFCGPRLFGRNPNASFVARTAGFAVRVFSPGDEENPQTARAAVCGTDSRCASKKPQRAASRIAFNPNRESQIIFITARVSCTSSVRFHPLDGLPAIAPHLARQPLGHLPLALPIHLEALADAADNPPLDAQLLALARLLQGAGQAAGIAPVLEGVQGRTGFAPHRARAGGFARVGAAGGQTRRRELRRSA